MKLTATRLLPALSLLPLLASAQTPLVCDPRTDQPVAGLDQLTTAGPLRISPAQLLANDTDPQGRALQLLSVTQPGRGTLATNADGTYTYTPTPGYVGSDSFTYLVQLAGPVLASPSTGHYYEYVSAPGSCWADAKTAAATRTYYGMTGYLATLTTAAEVATVARRAAGQYWFGASDAAAAGEWRWQTGPEAGQLFWRGAATGTAVAYSNWSPGEPNNYQNPFQPSGEHYGELYGGSGLWNDLGPCDTNGVVSGYLVEYGGLENCAPTLYAIGTVRLTVTAATLAAQAASQATTLAALPNPNGGQFWVQLAAASGGPAQLDLLDLQGRRVRVLFEGLLPAGVSRDLPVEAADLAAGLYVLRLRSGAAAQYLRVAVQH